MVLYGRRGGEVTDDEYVAFAERFRTQMSECFRKLLNLGICPNRIRMSRKTHLSLEVAFAGRFSDVMGVPIYTNWCDEIPYGTAYMDYVE